TLPSPRARLRPRVPCRRLGRACRADAAAAAARLPGRAELPLVGRPAREPRPRGNRARERRPRDRELEADRAAEAVSPGELRRSRVPLRRSRRPDLAERASRNARAADDL